jgi:fructokinase
VAKPRMLCLGEALVDLVGEQPVRSMRQVQRFAPHLGGTVANVAVVAARAGAPVSLAGAAGDDEWGRWLSAKLVDEGVDTSLFRLLTGVQTQLAFTAVDPAGEPTYELYGEPAETIGPAVADRLEQAVAAAAGLLISSNTLAGTDERAVTMRARELALSLGRPVVFDCNLRLHRWASRDDAAASANACVPGALLVRANRAEAELMTGEPDAERAAAALRAAGATLVVITLGAGGAILRGAEQAAIAAAPAEVVSAMGAGDAFTGTLLAALIHSDFHLAAVAAALGDAARAAARACEHWGSLD